MSRLAHTEVLLPLCLVGVFAIGSAGCDRAVDPPPPAVRVADDDERMKQAVADARASLATFRAALQNPAPSQTNFMVKYAAKDGDAVEHLWVAPVRADGGRFVGTVGNEPQRVGSVRAGQEVTVPGGEIVDWMYVDDGKLVGGYTIRVARGALPLKDRRDFDRSVPFRIE